MATIKIEPKANLQVRVDAKVKDAAEELFNDLGLTIGVVVNAMLRQALLERAVPFKIGGHPQEKSSQTFDIVGHQLEK